MKPFKFSLEKIYELRMQEEKEVKRHFGDIQRLVTQKEQEIAFMMKEKAEMMGDYQRDIDQMQVYFRYLARLDQQIMDEHQLLLGIKQQLAEILDLYVEAQKERKIIEKLRDKKLAEYHERTKKEEQKNLDDFRVRFIG